MPSKKDVYPAVLVAARTSGVAIKVNAGGSSSHMWQSVR
jgi:hypothetical protein